MYMTLESGQCGGKIGGGGLSFHDHSEGGAMDAVLHLQRKKMPNTNANERSGDAGDDIRPGMRADGCATIRTNTSKVDLWAARFVADGGEEPR